ncbi:M20/M25/M40 family metallo-hydrolase [bacterium]|nr:M20/M25/M40 family metallo-hydrolase [bacterium]
MSTEELLKILIDIPSVTGEEQRVCGFLASHLESDGWQVTRQPLDNGRFNIFAAAGDPVVTFSTHMDTVPPHFACREEGDRIFGRGACDAKGSLAAQVSAAAILREEGARIGLLFVVGEERGSDGAVRANTLPNRSRYLINGEPTGNRPASGTKGVLRVRLAAKGVAAHSAYPEEGESAILTLINVLDALQRTHWPSDPVLGHTTLNIGTIAGGAAANIVPSHAESEIMFRSVCGAEEMLRITSGLVDGRVDVEELYRCDPVRTFCPDGYDCEPVSFATDITSLGNWGTPLLLGPGSIRDAHTMHEHISRRELNEAVDTYVQIGRELERS